MTKRQKQIMDFIKRFRTKHGYSPTVREIMDAMGMSSPNGVECHLKGLVEDGHLKRTPKISRSLLPVE